MPDGPKIHRLRAATARTRVLVVLFLAIFAWAFAPATADAFQTARTSAQNSVVGTDALERLIDIFPGTAQQPGTTNLVAGGLDLGFSMDLGRVPDAHTFADALRIKNTDTIAHTIRITPQGAGLGSIALVAFAADSNPGDGPNVETIMPGTTELLNIFTSTAVAGSQTGTLRFEQVGDERFYRRELPIQTRQAPAAPTGLSAISASSPTRVILNWTAPPSTGVAGYNVYRANAAGGPYVKINPSFVAGTTYTDNAVVAGNTYWYRVRALASGVTPELEGADSNTTANRVIPAPTSVVVPAGGTNPANYINFATRASTTLRVVLPAGTLAGDTLNVQITDGTTTVGTTTPIGASGAQTVNVAGINATALAEGAVTLRAWLSAGAGSGSQTTGPATKDTIAAVTSSGIAATASNPANYINIATGISPGTATGGVVLPASSMTTDTVSIRLTQGALTTTGTSTGTAGSGTRNITGLSTNGWANGAVAVAARVTDVAGNDSGWVNGTAATRDTVAPPAPTAARIQQTTINPVDTINIPNVAAVPVTVTTNGAASSVEARLTRSATNVYGALAGTGTVTVPVNATTLADGNAGTVSIAARQYDAAGNPSAWFTGTAARKDTVAPAAPNFTRITFTNRWGNRWDRVDGSNGALGSLDEVLIHDYSDGANYPAAGYDAANNAGAFGRNNIDNGTIPRTLGYDIRDNAWNPIARICRYYTGNGTGTAVACP